MVGWGGVYLVAQPGRPLQQRLAGVLVDDEAPSFGGDGPHGGGLGGGRGRRLLLMLRRRRQEQERDAGRPAIGLGRQRGRAQCRGGGGGAGLDRRAGIMIRRGGGTVPRGARLQRRGRERRGNGVSLRHTYVRTQSRTRTSRSRCGRKKKGKSPSRDSERLTSSASH